MPRRKLSPYTRRVSPIGRYTEKPNREIAVDDVVCPSCKDAFPKLSEASRIYQFKDEHGRSLFGVRSCFCGQEAKCDEWTGAVERFICLRCSALCSPHVHSNTCPSCELRTLGFDPEMMRAALGESNIYITPSKNDMIESLLYGLLTGAPGLTTGEDGYE